MTQLLSQTQVHKAINFHTSILGVSGCGKTELSKAMFHYSPFSTLYVNTMKHQLQAIELNFTNWAELMFRHSKGTVVKAHITPPQHANFWEFAEIFRVLLDRIRVVQEVDYNHKFVIFIDEFRLFTNASNELLDLLVDVVRLGRNYNTYVVPISQRPHDIPFDILTQTDLVYSSFEDFDFDYFRRKKIRVSELPKYTFRYYPKTSQIGTPFDFRMHVGGVN